MGQKPMNFLKNPITAHHGIERKPIKKMYEKKDLIQNYRMKSFTD